MDEGSAMRQKTGFRRILLDSDSYEPISAHVGHDGYTSDLLPILQEPREDRPGVSCGFSGRGAKYIPSLAQSLVSDWMEPGGL